jgi:hypothetical protein
MASLDASKIKPGHDSTGSKMGLSFGLIFKHLDKITNQAFFTADSGKL